MIGRRAVLRGAVVALLADRVPASAAGAAAARTLFLAAGVALEMARIPPGTFTMGSPATEAGRDADEAPRTIVTLTQQFWLGRTHVTIGQWKSVMGRGVRAQLLRAIDDETLFDFGGERQTLRAYMHFERAAVDEYLANEDDDLPMYYVSWNDAREFCRRLNAIEDAGERLPRGYEYDLPTEAQWEYAARAPGRASDSHPLRARGWYDANSADGYRGKGFAVAGVTRGPRVVGGKEPNGWGLFDMAGNLWQWCRDWYAPYPGGSVTDPVGPAAGTMRVNRGGSFGSGARDARAANRAANPPAEASAYRGFRLALVPRQ